MVRVKERYLLVNILYPEVFQNRTKSNLPDILVYNQPTSDTFTGRTLTRAIKNEITNLFGDYGAGAVERTLRVKYQSNATSTFIIQCSREHYRMVWAAMTMINRVPTNEGPGKPCVFRVVRVSGTIKQVEQEAVRRARLLILAAKDEIAGNASDSLSALFGTKESTNDVAMVDVDDGSGSEANFDDDDD